MIKIFTVAILLLMSSSFLGCTGFKRDSEVSLQKSLDKAEQQLKAQGVSFEAEDLDNKVRVKMKVAPIIDESQSPKEQADKLQKLVNSMESYIENAGKYLKSRKGSRRKNVEVSLKIDLISQRLGQVKSLSELAQSFLPTEDPSGDDEKDFPYTVNYGEVKVKLCQKDSRSGPTAPVAAFQNEGHGVDEENLKLVQLILCQSKKQQADLQIFKERYRDLLDQTSQILGTHLFVELGANKNRRQDLELFKDIEFIKKQSFTFGMSYSDSEEPLSQHLSIEISMLELLYRLDLKKENGDNFLSSQVLDQILWNIRDRINFGDEKRDRALEDNYDLKEGFIAQLHTPVIKEVASQLFDSTFFKNTDEIITFVIAKDYENLKKFALADNINALSYNDNLKLGSSGSSNTLSDISAYGLSPLMVAAILDDEKAIEILSNVEGVDLTLKSEIFEADYLSIRSTSSRGGLGKIQRQWVRSEASGYYGRGGGSGGSGGGGWTSSGSSGVRVKSKGKYKNYTVLMVAVAEGNCEVIPVLLKKEPNLVNHRSSASRHPLYISTKHEESCFKELIQAGSMDFEWLFQVSQYKYYDLKEWANRNIGGVQNLFNFLSDSFKENKDHQKKARHILIHEKEIELTVKIGLEKKFPISIDELRSELEKHGIRHRKVSDRVHKGFDHFEINFDMAFAKYKGINIANEKLFGISEDEEKHILLNAIFKRSDQFIKSNRVKFPSQMLRNLLDEFSKFDHPMLLEWLNSESSFFGQNPLVAASMRNKSRIALALLTVNGVKVDVIDKQTGYTAFEWQYAVSPFAAWFAKSPIAKAIKKKGGIIRDEKRNKLGVFDPNLKEKMQEVLEGDASPFSSSQ